VSSTPLGRLAGGLRRVLLRADHGPVRRACLACAEGLIRLLAHYLGRGLPAGVYVRGGFGAGEPVLGVSDIDLVAVVAGGTDGAGDPWSRVMGRWQRLERRLPGLHRIAYLECYSEAELAKPRRTRFTYGLDGRGPRSLFFAERPGSWSQPARRSLPLLLPDLWPVDCWRFVSGQDLRPRTDAGEPTCAHLVAWVHLQYWWRLGLRALNAPAAPWVTYASVKLVADAAKIVLWLEHGEQHLVRRESLQRALEVLPEEEAAIAFALSVLDGRPDCGAPPIELVWPSFVRVSGRIAQRLAADLAPMGATAVRLEGLAPIEPTDDGGARPLSDWTALVWPPGREESFVVGPGTPFEVPAVLSAAECSTRTSFVTLLGDGLIIRPGRQGREWFRAVDFGATDPVSEAMLGARPAATFANVPGWSALDTAARAVAEHAAWLRLPRDPAVEPADILTAHLAGLFSAARAGLFLRSAQDHEPVLPVTFEATADALADRLPSYRSAIEDAYESYRTAVDSGRAATREVLRAAAGALDELGCYPGAFPQLLPRQRSRLTEAGEGVAGAGAGAAGAGESTTGAGHGVAGA
jgi:hypothetical protein